MIGILGGATPLRLERKAREVLTLLALHAPAALGVDELARLVWDDPPPSAGKTLRAHLSRIRSALAAAGHPDAIQSRGGGAYRLTAETDVLVVQRLRQQARRMLAAQPDAAADLFAQARELWRGAPELPATVAAQALLVGWERDHQQLTSEHLQAVVLGRYPQAAIGELAARTAADPLDEPSWVAYVTALHRSQRQVEALAAVARARRALAEMGLDPGPALHRAQAEVLNDPVEITHATAQPQPRYTPNGVTAYLQLSEGSADILLLNPAMVTLDGLFDEPHVRRAHDLLAGLGRVVCLDRRGVGLSAPLDPAVPPLEQWLDDVGDVVAAAGLRRPLLMANFDTGLIALEYAARHPDAVRGLVLVTCYPTYQRRPDYPHGWDEATTRDLIDGAVDPARPRPLDTAGIVAPSLAADTGFRAWWTRIGRRGAAPGTARTIRTVGTSLDLRDRLPRVTAPTLVVHPRHCTNLDPGHGRYLAEHLPDATLRLVEGVDAVWFTQPDAVVAAIGEVIGRR